MALGSLAGMQMQAESLPHGRVPSKGGLECNLRSRLLAFKELITHSYGLTCRIC
jgi:hypothetical protein